MKSLLLSLALLTATSSIYAQLYVSPNGANDSYIYVDDEVLFVEQEVNLVANSNDPTTEASIYLRNDSQLVQGTSGSTNLGTGFISIFQDSNSDSYDYNFWCSPVGASTSTGNRNFGIARMFDEVTLTDSNIALHTGAVNGSSTPLTISRRWFYRWNPLTQRWAANGTGDNVPAGSGFIMKGTDVTVHGDPFSDPQNQNYDFRGRPNNGDMIVPIQFGVPFSDGNVYNYTLAGNPYPSALNLYDVFWDIDNAEIIAFRFWDEDRSINSHLYTANKGGYGTWIPGPNDAHPGFYTVPTFLGYDTNGNPTGPSGGMGTAFERLNSPVGQGFMIEVDNIGNGSIIIKNSHRRYMKEGAGNNSEFRNPLGGGDNSPSTFDDNSNTNLNVLPQMRIWTIFGDNTHMRDMLLVFNPLSTDGWDRGMDATHPMDGANAEAYFKIGNSTDTYKNLVIQSVPFEISKQVPIAFSLDQETKFAVKSQEQINTPFEKAYLYDSLNETYQEITDNKYGAVQLLPAGTYEDRFYITFRGSIDDRGKNDPIIAGTNELLENVDFFQNNRIATLEVSNPEAYDIKSLNIFDMSGKLVLSQQNLGTQRKLAFPTANFSDGVYLVKLATVDNFEIDYKITVNNR